MARQPENNFIDSVHAHLVPRSEGGPYRMKNHNEYIGGVADVWYSGKKGDIWVEYKYEDITNKRSVRLKLTELQIDWLTGRAEEGRKVFVVLGTKQGGIIFKRNEWTKTFDQAALSRRIVDRRSIAEWISTLTLGFYEHPERSTTTRNRLKRCL